MKRCHWIALILLAVSALSLNAQNFGIKSNLLGWGTTNPNLGIEFSVGRKSTISVAGALNPWDFSNDRHFHLWNAMPEYRYFFCERFTGHFIGINALGGQYNAKNVNFPLKSLIFKSTVEHPDPADPASAENGWPNLTSEQNKGRHVEGWYVGGGITYGYQWMLSKHWNLEASISVGYAYSKLKFYGRCKRIIDERTLHYVGPTSATVSFMYLF
ncbi:MAG: DUF3575 domain-containing protein [Muribaculaceae bacterium]|nr:DUF3575 domain-containing protein [Muribaculaceae bacterium]MDE7392959.1 DUF3575 domain-containing protein [Muribaculaceae bacterium]